MAVRACTLLLLIAAAHAFIDEAVDVLKLGKEIGEEVINSWDILGKPLNLSGGVELPVVRRRERLVLARLDHITRMIERLELDLQKNSAVTMLLARAAGQGARLEMRLLDMSDLLGRVVAADRQMREYVRLQKQLERATLEDFAQWCVSHDPNALPGLLERIHSLIAPPHRNLLGRDIMALAVDELQVCCCCCRLQQATQRDLL